MAKRNATTAPAPVTAQTGGAGAPQPDAQANGSGAAGSDSTQANTAAVSQVLPPVDPPAVTALIVEDTPAVLVLPETEEWPLAVAIYNHSHADLTCRVSGAYLPAAGFAKTHLHDPDHARAVAESLSQLAAANFIELHKLVIEKA